MGGTDALGGRGSGVKDEWDSEVTIEGGASYWESRNTAEGDGDGGMRSGFWGLLLIALARRYKRLYISCASLQQIDPYGLFDHMRYPMRWSITVADCSVLLAAASMANDRKHPYVPFSL